MSQTLLTLLTVTLFGMLVCLTNLDGEITKSANATLDFTRAERFCFQTGPDPFEDAQCFKGPHNCQKALEEVIANGGTVTGPCTHAFKPVKP
ncbi:MAG TPA: hypothetical protein VJ599_00215 [Nitrososphaeraceae archaeon]|nr:hypothetical protein [Nitrososphaeraceae archaeon]